jgi:hypothetical protein
MCLLSSVVQAFAIKWRFLWLENAEWRKYSLEIHTYFQKENTVKDSQTSIFHAVMSALICVPAIKHYRLLFLQMNVSPTWKRWQKRVFLWQGNSVLKRKQCVRYLSFPLDSILPGDTCVSSTQQYRPFYCKANDSPTWNHWQFGSIMWKFKLSSQKGIFSNRFKLLNSNLHFKHSLVSLTISIQAYFP